jgi:hypothetical protein
MNTDIQQLHTNIQGLLEMVFTGLILMGQDP